MGLVERRISNLTRSINSFPAKKGRPRLPPDDGLRQDLPGGVGRGDQVGGDADQVPQAGDAA